MFPSRPAPPPAEPGTVVVDDDGFDDDPHADCEHQDRDGRNQNHAAPHTEPPGR
jgi:hypothetical protein